MTGEILLDTENLFFGVSDPYWASEIIWSLVWWHELSNAERPSVMRSYGKTSDDFVRDFIRGLWVSGATLDGLAEDRAGGEPGDTVWMSVPDETLDVSHTRVGWQTHAAERALLSDLNQRFPLGEVGEHRFLLGSGDREVAQWVDALTNTGPFCFVLPPLSVRSIGKHGHPNFYSHLNPRQVELVNKVLASYRRERTTDGRARDRDAANRTRVAAGGRYGKPSRRATLHGPAYYPPPAVYPESSQAATVAERLAPLNDLTWAGIAWHKLGDEQWFEAWELHRALAARVLDAVVSDEFERLWPQTPNDLAQLRAGASDENLARSVLGRAALLVLAREKGAENGAGFRGEIAADPRLAYLADAIVDIQPTLGSPAP